MGPPTHKGGKLLESAETGGWLDAERVTLMCDGGFFLNWGGKLGNKQKQADGRSMNQAEMGRLGVPLVLREWSLLERAWRRPGCALRGQMGGQSSPVFSTLCPRHAQPLGGLLSAPWDCFHPTEHIPVETSPVRDSLPGALTSPSHLGGPFNFVNIMEGFVLGLSSCSGGLGGFYTAELHFSRSGGWPYEVRVPAWSGGPFWASDLSLCPFMVQGVGLSEPLL